MDVGKSDAARARLHRARDAAGLHHRRARPAVHAARRGHRLARRRLAGLLPPAAGRPGGGLRARDGRQERCRSRIFINAPYDRFVTANSRFWHASGIDMALDANGVKREDRVARLDRRSAASPSPRRSRRRARAARRRHGVRAASQTRRAPSAAPIASPTLRAGLQPVGARPAAGGDASTSAASCRRGDRDPHRIRPGDAEDHHPVEIRVYPERFTSRLRAARRKAGGSPATASSWPAWSSAACARSCAPGASSPGSSMSRSISSRLRPRQELDLAQSPPELPTQASALEDLQSTLVSLANKLERVPLDTMAQDLSHTLKTIDSMVKRLDGEMAPTLRRRPPDTDRAAQDPGRNVEDHGRGEPHARQRRAKPRAGSFSTSCRTRRASSRAPRKACARSPTISSATPRPSCAGRVDEPADIVLAIMLLTACARRSRSASSRSMHPSRRPRRPARRSIAVTSVAVPDLVDRPQIVVRMGPNQVGIGEQARWAEPLKSAIARVVAANLATALNGRVAPQRAGDADYRVRSMCSASNRRPATAC